MRRPDPFIDRLAITLGVLWAAAFIALTLVALAVSDDPARLLDREPQRWAGIAMSGVIAAGVGVAGVGWIVKRVNRVRSS